MIEKICKAHTDLLPEDIHQVKEVAKILDVIADLMQADIFIDCPTQDRDKALVVAQARPTSVKSLYKRSVVGEFAFRKNEPAALRTLDVGLSTMDLMATTQENRDVRQNVSPIKSSRGKVIACLIAETDVTAAQQNLRKVSMLSKATERLSQDLVSSRSNKPGLHDHLTDGVLIFNPKGIVVFANPVAKKIYTKLGYMNMLEGMAFSNLALEDVRFEDILGEKQITSEGVKFGNRILNLKYALMSGHDDEPPIGAVMLINDVSDARAAEKELILKSVAIKEIHHRVKNNLQTIASLLRLQSRRIEGDGAKRAFSKSISRVLSIAATHEILAQNGMDDVELIEMLKRIKHSVADLGSELGCKIRISIEGDSIKTNSEVATSIALVVNELVQNCLKYAFEGRSTGLVRVEIARGNVYSNIAIIDDGIGYDTQQKENATSLGRRIVQRIVEDKLGGSIVVESGSGGTRVMFSFNHDPGTTPAAAGS